MQELTLAEAELIGRVEVVFVGRVAFENHELLVVQDQVRAFVERRKDMQRVVEFFGKGSCCDVAACSLDRKSVV